MFLLIDYWLIDNIDKKRSIWIFPYKCEADDSKAFSTFAAKPEPHKFLAELNK